MKIKAILVSQPAPVTESSPYLEMARKEKLRLDFHPFIHVEGVDSRELRSQRIDLGKYTGVIFTSRNAIDHYFRLAEEMRFSVPDSMRYICQSEAVANYLQKHVVYRKRKISFGERQAKDLLPLLKKHHSETYILPSSDTLNEEISSVLDESGVAWTRVIMYRTVCSNLEGIQIEDYDMLVFFSPQEVKSLFENFGEFKQGDVKIAVFGNNTGLVAQEAGLKIDIVAPTRESPSMAMAIEKFLKLNK